VGRRDRGNRARTWALPASALTLVGVAIACWAAAPAAAATQPNIIVIQTDDQDAGSLTRQVMPKTVRYVQRPGTTFTDYIDSGPLCCPSRAVLLTGQYGHNNGVMWNHPNPYGDLRGKGNTLPVWLQRAGYRTVHIGKYLNFYAVATGDPNEVAPGWDEWHTVLEPVDYYNYTLRDNGRRAVPYGTRPGDYLTSVLNDEAVRMIHRYVPGQHPLFMALDQFAPHTPTGSYGRRCRWFATPAPGDNDLFRHARFPTPPSFNEADVSDKPPFVSERHRWGRPGDRTITERHRCRLASLREVDRGVGRIVKALRSEHELANTAIVFTSDNGWIDGPHRIAGGKVNPYEEALHVPFAIRLPRDLRSKGVPHKLSSTVANVDVAPTIAKLAGAKPCARPGVCRIMDGRSMLKAIRTNGHRWPQHRGILLELKTNRALPFVPCDYQGIRTSRQVFVEYHSWTETQGGNCVPGQAVEHYDLRTDPFELQNQFPAPPRSREASVERALAARLARLKDCAGIAGRDPEPPSGHYCE
jgi:N-acetylglucosamine-6-sulfatase